MSGLLSLKGEIDKCVRCGTCRSTCPTVRVLGRETSSARGKLTIVDSYLRGEALSDTFLRHLKECSMCGACKAGCPNGVDTTGVFQAARAEFVEKKGLPFAASFILKNLLDSSKIMPFAMKAASLVKGLVFKGADTGLVSRFSLPLVGGGRLVPPIAKTFFLDLPEAKRLSNERSARVAFYAGCGINYLMPDVGVSSIRALEKVATVAIPPEQICCGMPAYYMGDMETAKSLARKNLEAFESYDLDYIVTSCATCTHGLKTFKTILGDEPGLKERVERFTGKVRDITEFLASSGFRSEKGGAEKTVVTYHDPCHLNRALGIRDEPRTLITSNKNLTLKEMRFPCSCCGLGGGLTYANYDLSINIARRKAETIRDTGAQIVATACPGCIVQLRDALHQYGVNAKVAHVVELL